MNTKGRSEHSDSFGNEGGYEVRDTPSKRGKQAKNYTLDYQANLFMSKSAS